MHAEDAMAFMAATCPAECCAKPFQIAWVRVAIAVWFVAIVGFATSHC